MAAATLNLLLEQGATFERKLIFKDELGVTVDLTGQTFRAKIKKTISDTTVIATFVCTVLDQITNKGEMVMSLTATVTAGIALKPQKTQTRVDEPFCYDLERQFVSGEVDRILEGVVEISPEVTT